MKAGHTGLSPARTRTQSWNTQDTSLTMVRTKAGHTGHVPCEDQDTNAGHTGLSPVRVRVPRVKAGA